MEKCTIYVDVNGNFNGPKVWQKWPHLTNRVLTYFINGGEPRNVPDKGDCQTPATPMMTTAQHYKSTLFCPTKHPNVEAFSCDTPPNPRGYWTNTSLSHPGEAPCPACSSFDDEFTTSTCEVCKGGGLQYLCPWGCGPLVPSPWLDKVYVFYPMFTRQDRILPRAQGAYEAPVSFVHNCMSWGCQAFVEPARKLGVKAYGGGNSPDGLVPHADCFKILSKALCTVYLKGGGAVDYSILEPMAAGCPTTFHSSYVHNCRLYELLELGVTCLTWETEEEMQRVIERLRIPAYNRQIGEAGRERLKKVLWNDPTGFHNFMRKVFG